MDYSKKRQNSKTRQNRDSTHENDKKEGYKKQTEHREETNSHKWDDIKTEALTDYPCSRGVVRGELNWLRIVAHAKDDFRGNILVIFNYIIRLKFNIFRK